MSWTTYESPLGPLTLVALGNALSRVYFPGQAKDLDGSEQRSMTRVANQLKEYFAGDRHDFELPIDLAGTPLQIKVWERLRRIPYGETVSYAELTADIDPEVFPKDMQPYERIRAAAGAVARTPVPIVVPCHRVIGANGRLTGYGGGLHRKRALLELERGAAQLPLV